MSALNKAQLRAVRWYIGDVEGSDPFWSDPKAYVTLNALFFPGLTAERARAAEGKRLNPAIVSDGKRLGCVLCDLMSAFRSFGREQTTYRVERFSDFERMRERGGTLSFTSTSTAGFLPAYQDRVGIALMRFALTPETPCIPMAEVLPHYAKADEAEVLLPPGMRLALTELPLTDAERSILDAKGEPPVLSVCAKPEGMESLEGFWEVPDCPVPGVLDALNEGREPADVGAYLEWKRGLNEYRIVNNE